MDRRQDDEEEESGPDFYKVLQVEKEATKSQIDEAIKKTLLKNKTQSTPSSKKKTRRRACEVLGDAQKR